MKRLTYALAALTVLISTCPVAQAEFKGALRRNEPFAVQVDNTANGAFKQAGVTIFYLGNRRALGSASFTVEPGTLSNIIETIPRSARRVIIEVSPAYLTVTPITINQGVGTSFMNSGDHDVRLVFDVE